MSYASDLGLKVGSKIKIIGNEKWHRFAIGETVTVVEDCSDEDTPNWRCSNKEDLSYVDCGWVYVGEFELVKDVTYTVPIKGTPITLTQDELNELSI